MNNGVQTNIGHILNKNNESSDNLRQFKERQFVLDSNLRMIVLVVKNKISSSVIFNQNIGRFNIICMIVVTYNYNYI